MPESNAIDPFQQPRDPRHAVVGAGGDPDGGCLVEDVDWGDVELHLRWRVAPLRKACQRATQDWLFGRDDEPGHVTAARMRSLDREAERWHKRQIARVALRSTAPRRAGYRASRVSRVLARKAAKATADPDGEPPDIAALHSAAGQLGVETRGQSLYDIMRGVIGALGARCAICGACEELGICAWEPRGRPPLVYVSCPQHTRQDGERRFAWHGVPDEGLS